MCNANRHKALLHRERQQRPVSGELVETKCTSLCKATEGRVSCSKIVDVAMKERPNNAYRVYAILDEQSNLSLADELGVVGPCEKYFLTTCSGEKEVKYGRRVTGAIVESLKVAPYSFTIARELETKVQVICARSKGNVSVFRYFITYT